MVLYAGVDESDEKYLERIKNKYTNEELILELYKRQKEHLAELIDYQENVVKFERDIICRRYEKQINNLQKQLERLQSKYLTKNYVYDQYSGEYLDFFFSEMDQLIQDLNMKPQMRAALSEIIGRHKKTNYKTSPVLMFEEIFNRFGLSALQ